MNYNPFANSGARIDAAVAAAAEIEDPAGRVAALLAHLRTLPP